MFSIDAELRKLQPLSPEIPAADAPERAEPPASLLAQWDEMTRVMLRLGDEVASLRTELRGQRREDPRGPLS